MIKINGKVFSEKVFSGSNNVVIVNGRVINGNEGTGELKKFDEKKIEYGGKVEKIKINSDVAYVDIFDSNSSNIEAHFYGQAEVDGEIEFDVKLVKHELKITVAFVGNCYNSTLKLDVSVPHKTFKEISIKTSSADVSLNGGISTESLKVETLSGDLETCATFASLFSKSMSGDVELCINANRDIIVDISTISGNVSAEFGNVGKINLSTGTLSGNIRNYHKEENGYTADGDISTMSGNIRIR